MNRLEVWAGNSRPAIREVLNTPETWGGRGPEPRMSLTSGVSDDRTRPNPRASSTSAGPDLLSLWSPWEPVVLSTVVLLRIGMAQPGWPNQDGPLNARRPGPPDPCRSRLTDSRGPLDLLDGTAIHREFVQESRRSAVRSFHPRGHYPCTGSTVPRSQRSQ